MIVRLRVHLGLFQNKNSYNNQKNPSFNESRTVCCLLFAVFLLITGEVIKCSKLQVEQQA